MKSADYASSQYIYSNVNELIHGKRGVTPDTALCLEQLFGMSARFWLNLQLAWDIYHLVHSHVVKEIGKIGILHITSKVVDTFPLF
jgi:plasmid maintenance system antidote protein VapI